MKKHRNPLNFKFDSDDCAICEFMEEIERGNKQHTETELKKAFRKQEERTQMTKATSQFGKIKKN